MNFTVTYRPGVERDLRRLPKDVLKRVDAAILKLSNDPRPSGCVKLAGHSHLWRVRVGDWRIVYEIDDQHRVVDIATVAHRREVYRGL